MNIDHDQRSDGIGGRKVTDGGAILIPVGGRVELGTVLIGRNHVGGGHKTVTQIKCRFITFLLSEHG